MSPASPAQAFDDAKAQWAHGLVVSELLALHFQDRTPPCAVLAVPPAAATYRASGLVPWHSADIRSSPTNVCFWGKCGNVRDVSLRLFNTAECRSARPVG